MAVCTRSGLAWRSFVDLAILAMVLVMPAIREWQHWDNIHNTHFFMLHIGILGVDLRMFGQLDHNGLMMMTHSDFLIYVFSIAIAWVIDLFTLGLHVWQLSTDWSGEQDDISEQRIQTTVVAAMLLSTGIRTLYFGIVYSADKSRMHMDPHIVATVAHAASLEDHISENVKSDYAMGIKRGNKAYKLVPVSPPEEEGDTTTTNGMLYLPVRQGVTMRGRDRAQHTHA